MNTEVRPNNESVGELKDRRPVRVPDGNEKIAGLLMATRVIPLLESHKPVGVSERLFHGPYGTRRRSSSIF